MPQLRTFSGFASTPNIGSAIVGAAGVAQRAEEARMQAANERSRISSQLAIANMETAARQQALQQQMLKEHQELQVQKAYQEAQLGLRDREIAMHEKDLDNEIAQQAAVSSSRLAMQRQVEELIQGGSTPAKAFERAVITHGPAAQVPGSAYSDVINNSAGAMAPDIEMGNIYDVPGQPGYKYGRTGPNSIQYFKPGKEAAVPEELEFDPSKVKYGSRVFDKPASTEANKLEKERDALKKELRSADFAAHRQSLTKSKTEDAKLSAGDRARIKEYQEREKEIAELNARISELRSSLTNSAVIPSRGSSANRVGRFEIIRD